MPPPPIPKPPPPKLAKWFYVDPFGVIQGPYSGAEMLYWFHYGFFSGEVLCRTELERDFHTIDEWRLICGGHMPFRFNMISYEEARRRVFYKSGRPSANELPKLAPMHTPLFMDPSLSLLAPPITGQGLTYDIDSDCAASDDETLPPRGVVKEVSLEEYEQYVNDRLDLCEREFCDFAYRPLPPVADPPPMPPNPAIYDTWHCGLLEDPWRFEDAIVHQKVPAPVIRKRNQHGGRRRRQRLDALPANEKKRERMAGEPGEEGENPWKFEGPAGRSGKRLKKGSRWSMENVELPCTLERLEGNRHVEAWRIVMDGESGEKRRGEGFNPWSIPHDSRHIRFPKSLPSDSKRKGPVPVDDCYFKEKARKPRLVSRGTMTRPVQKKDTGSQTDPISISADVLESVLSSLIDGISFRIQR